MTVIKRNQLIILSLTVMIVVAGYLNFSYQGSDPFAQELTGSVGGKLGEATLVQNGMEDMDIGYAEPVSSTVNGEEADVQDSKAKTGTVSQAVQSGTTEQYFSESRAEKERIRDEEVSIFERVIGNTSASKEAQEKAQTALTEISQKWEREMIIERMIKAKGFKDAVVFINDGSVNVVVLNGKQLTTAQVAQIQEIVTREAKVTADKIKIVTK